MFRRRKREPGTGSGWAKRLSAIITAQNAMSSGLA
jgi:hypothetical protein